MDNGYITAGFAWRPGSQIDVKRVELLICRAEDIYQDHFDNDDVTVENLKYSTYNLEQWNSEGGSFCVCPALKPGVYHFVFRIDNGEQRELTISDYYDRTFLGNGRAVNYIEVLANNKKNLARAHGNSVNVNSVSDEKHQSTKMSNSKDSHCEQDQSNRSCVLL